MWRCGDHSGKREYTAFSSSEDYGSQQVGKKGGGSLIHHPFKIG